MFQHHMIDSLHFLMIFPFFTINLIFDIVLNLLCWMVPHPAHFGVSMTLRCHVVGILLVILCAFSLIRYRFTSKHEHYCFAE